MNNYSNKILSLKDLKKKISEIKNKNKIVGLCHGVFDLVHIGHIEHFKEAKNSCDVLCVTITKDKFVKKTPGTPIFSEETRSNFLSSIQYIDFIAINEWSDAVNTIKLLKPNIYIKGPDYKSAKNDLSRKINSEVKIAKEIGCKLIYTNAPTQSSTKIINNNTNYIFDDSQKNFLSQIKKLTDKENILDLFNRIKKLKVSIIGEAIIDQYIKCDPLGKSGKEPILMFKKIKSTLYAGGSLHIANNISSLVKNVELLTMIGDDMKYFDFIKKKLNKNIKSVFYKKKNSTTILKTRYIDQFNNNKIFGTYDFTENDLDLKNVNSLLKKLSTIKRDIIIISDFSHGFLNKKIIKKIIEKKNSFIAVNAQLNASNILYHNLMNYNGTDLLIINENEIRHEMRDKENDIELIVKKFCLNFRTKYIVVTRGSNGSLLYFPRSKKFYYAPAFASKVIDKIGAGDTMLIIISLCLGIGFNPLVSLFLGNIAGRISVETLGNQNLFKDDMLLKRTISILK